MVLSVLIDLNHSGSPEPFKSRQSTETEGSRWAGENSASPFPDYLAWGKWPKVRCLSSTV